MRELRTILLKLKKEDAAIIRQMYAIVYRYLEKKGRI